jgi:hypothetical protein
VLRSDFDAWEAGTRAARKIATAASAAVTSLTAALSAYMASDAKSATQVVSPFRKNATRDIVNRRSRS